MVVVVLQVVTGNTASFTVDTKGLDGELDIRVTGPDGGQIPARLVKLQSGLHRAEYRADQVINSSHMHLLLSCLTCPMTH